MIRIKEIEKLPPKPAKNDGEVITAQAQGKVLVLDCYRNRTRIGRFCLDTETNQYRSWVKDKWGSMDLMRIFGHRAEYYGYCYYSGSILTDTKKDLETIQKLLPGAGKKEMVIREIGRCEESYRAQQRDRRAESLARRTAELMAKVPPTPKDIKEWIHRSMGGEDYLMKKTGEKKWVCTNCRHECTEKELGGPSAIVEDGLITCPSCKKTVRIRKRKRTIRQQAQCMLLQDVDESQSVARHIDALIVWTQEGRKVKLSEGVRIFLHRDNPRKKCSIYYSIYRKSDWPQFDLFGIGNESNRRIESGYLYPEGIAKALKGTRYSVWDRIFERAASEGLFLDYNAAMIASNDMDFVRMCEYLLKGRFRRLLAESINRISIYNSMYQGVLDSSGTTIEEVFGIRDRQKINRIRDQDGGELMVEWMRIAEDTGMKVSQAFLSWADKNKLRPKELEGTAGKMTAEQVMNYIRRQAEESYSGKSDSEVISQWKDYLSMCLFLGKNLEDEMVYRPRELKRRHDEAVEEVRKQRIINEMRMNKERAEEMERKMREKFPGAEENLMEIREKFEYENEEYRILVPRRLSEISEEGYALHHCAGASERYFERIMRHETYICFLRRVEEPDVPYYTIEVEPGGTIRQHRSMYDEEPGIEEIRGFLREWQSVIRRRMKEEDYKRAALSRKLREDNIRELQEKNNTRVLEGLMEDFMEAEDLEPTAIAE